MRIEYKDSPVFKDSFLIDTGVDEDRSSMRRYRRKAENYLSLQSFSVLGQGC